MKKLLCLLSLVLIGLARGHDGSRDLHYEVVSCRASFEAPRYSRRFGPYFTTKTAVAEGYTKAEAVKGLIDECDEYELDAAFCKSEVRKLNFECRWLVKE